MATDRIATATRAAPGRATRGAARPAGGWCSGLLADRGGAAIVEFAFLAPLLLLLLLGTIELARFLFVQSSLEGAVAAAAREAMLEPAAGDARLREVLEANADGFDPAGLAGFTVTRTVDAAAGVTRITIRATLPFDPIVTLLLPTALTLEATGTTVIAGS